MNPPNTFNPTVPARDLQLDLLVFREKAGHKEVWVAQCLQHDICVQADTLPELTRRFERVFTGNVILAFGRKDVPLVNLPPAPSRFFTIFKEQARPLGEPEPLNLSPDRFPESFRNLDLPRGRVHSRLADLPMEPQLA